MRISDWSSDVCSSDLDKQLAFVGQATTAAEARYRDTRALLKRLGLAPTRFVRQSRVAMGGPYEPVRNQDSDPEFRQLFARSEESRVGKESVSTCRVGWMLHHEQKNNPDTLIQYSKNH